MSIRTLAELFMVAAGHQKADLLLYKEDGKYHPVSTTTFVDRVRKLSWALRKAGIEAGDRVALMAGNGPHWPEVDFATLTAGAALVPIYPTLLPEQVAYIVRDSGAKIVFIETREQLEGLLDQAADLPGVELFVLIRGGAGEENVRTFDAFRQEGDDVDGEAFGDRAHAVQPDDLASLVYTSGTTGQPKGVMLSHGNFVSNVLTGADLLPMTEEYYALSFLPLSHVFERMVNYCYFLQGVSIAYAESVQTVAENLGEVRPQVFVSVPRVYEKVLARVYDNVEKEGGLKQRIFDWAVGVGRRALPYRIKGQSPPGLLGVELGLADRLVFSKIKARLGGRFVFAVSGGAPLGQDVAEFFWGAGIEIYEGYGLTETAPVIAVNFPGNARLGSVGRPAPGVDVKIAEDGEILARGPNVMKGYFGNPEATAEVIDGEGWFHTGDIGHIDDDGFLIITDRKKEILVNAYGKNIAPAPIENKLKGSRYIGQAVLIGDRRKFLSALLVPDFDALTAWAGPRGLDPSDFGELLPQPQVVALFQDEVEAINQQTAHYESIQAFRLIPHEFTLEGGELTPTQKVKRRVINEKYGDLIESMYAED